MKKNMGFGMMIVDHDVTFVDGNKPETVTAAGICERFYVKRRNGGWTIVEATSKKNALEQAQKEYKCSFIRAITYNEYLKHGLKFYE